jgi:molybdenum cofactor cytidylyltransferase
MKKYRKDSAMTEKNQSADGIGFVIMASGFGRRFGGNKLLAPFGEKPLICQILDKSDGLFFRRVCVTRYEEVEQLCRERGIQSVLHDLPYRSDTVRLGIEALEEDDESNKTDGPKIQGCMFCPGDQPLLKRTTLERLKDRVQEEPEFIWRLHDGNRPGAPVYFPAWAFAELKTLPQGKGGSAVIRKYPECVKQMSVQDPYELMDVDSPEDLIPLSLLLEEGC